jgi:hypothetical protein
MSASEQDEDTRKDELIFELGKRRYDHELQRTKDLDDKAAGLIGYVTIVTGLLVGLGTFGILEKLSKPEYYIPYFGGIGLLLFSIISSLMSIRLTKWDVVPKFEDLQSVINNQDYKYRTIMRRIFLAMSDAVNNNRKNNNEKVKWTKISWFCLIGGLVLVLVYVIIFTTTGNQALALVPISSRA